MLETFRIIKKLCSVRSANLTGFDNTFEYEKCLLHIENLIDSAILLFKNNYYEQSTFLIITILEEISKAEICIYRGNGKDIPTVKRGKDGLYNHKLKHHAIANDIIFKYLKAREIYGIKTTNDVLLKLKSGAYITIRENALYFRTINGKCIVSDESITEKSTKVLLSICIEVFDDIFWGLSAQSNVILDRVTEKFRAI